MIKQLLIFLCFLLTLPAYAGQLEKELAKNDNVFLYIYQKDCGLCQAFNPVYDNVSKRHKDKFGFLKIDAQSFYGQQLCMVYNVRFLPYAVMIHSKSKETVLVHPRCLVSEPCTEKVIKSFEKESQK